MEDFYVVANSRCCEPLQRLQLFFNERNKLLSRPRRVSVTYECDSRMNEYLRNRRENSSRVVRSTDRVYYFDRRRYGEKERVSSFHAFDEQKGKRKQ